MLCYSKGHEITAKGHQLPKELQIPELLEYADKSLRLELVMRQLELKRRGLDMAGIGMNLLLKCYSRLWF